MPRNRKLDIVLNDVLIENVAAEGKAISHVRLPEDDPQEPGRVLFVEFAVPGDIVDVKLPARKKASLKAG